MYKWTGEVLEFYCQKGMAALYFKKGAFTNAVVCWGLFIMGSAPR